MDRLVMGLPFVFKWDFPAFALSLTGFALVNLVLQDNFILTCERWGITEILPGLTIFPMTCPPCYNRITFRIASWNGRLS